MTEQMDRIWAHGAYRQIQRDGKEFILAEHGHDRFTITINDDDLHIVLHLTGETLDAVLEAGCNIRNGSFYRLRMDNDSEIGGAS